MGIFSSLFKRNPYSNELFRSLMNDIDSIFIISNEQKKDLEDRESKKEGAGVEYFFNELRSRLQSRDEDDDNRKINEIIELGCKRAKITGSGCDQCMHLMGKSVTIEEARNMIGHNITDKCECPFFFSPDLDSRVK